MSLCDAILLLWEDFRITVWSFSIFFGLVLLALMMIEVHDFAFWNSSLLLLTLLF